MSRYPVELSGSYGARRLARDLNDRLLDKQDIYVNTAYATYPAKILLLLTLTYLTKLKWR